MIYTALHPSSLPLSTAALTRLWHWGVVAVVGSLALGAAQANMIVDTTRVIYPEARREVSFRVTNTAKDRPGFVQMWLDDGNANVAPEDATSPFNLTPPIARLGADGSQVVRLVYTGEPLPADREGTPLRADDPERNNDSGDEGCPCRQGHKSGQPHCPLR